MARRRLDLDVTVQEMLRLREEGISNKQIAGQLDVHYNTILKYIGKEPRSPRTSVVLLARLWSRHSTTGAIRRQNAP